jgi:hypothetical protein
MNVPMKIEITEKIANELRIPRTSVIVMRILRDLLFSAWSVRIRIKGNRGKRQGDIAV